MSHDVFDRLMLQISQRVKELPPGSYTTKLVQGGVAAMGAKILEEADEVVRAAGEPGQAGTDHLIYEACDLLYHLWVLLGSRNISLESIRSELARREGTSGIAEKASRKQEPESNNRE